jgi:hypothetical protein
MKLIPRPQADPAPELEPEPGNPAAPAPAPGSQNHPVPRPPWMKVVNGGGNQNQNQDDSSTGPEPGTSQQPGTGTGTSGPAASAPVPVLELAGRAVLTAARVIAAALLRLAETPGHPLNRAWTYEPGSLAAHHVHAKSHERAAELQLHAAGKVLAITGIGLLALAESARGQRIALAVLALVGAAIGFLVF